MAVKSNEHINFQLTESDLNVLAFLMKSTGITSKSQIAKLALREFASSRGWAPESVKPEPETATG